MRILRFLEVMWLANFTVVSLAQAPVRSAPAGAALSVFSSTATAGAALQANSADWARATVKKISLNRTPPLFDTDEPAAAEISTADVRCLRTGGKLYVQMSWHDTTHDTASLEGVPKTAPETRFHKVPTEAEDRFFDAAAVMVPDHPGSALNPSLQMGDAEHPVHIYYWNSTRGAMLMTASGRATTRRTGQSFPASATYQNSQWVVTFELPDQTAGAPLAFAIWNGSQKDRDGRKYFSAWYSLE
jgi:ethylbenzene dehydrogenase